MDQSELLFRSGQRFVLQIQLLSIDHTAAARTCTQCSCGPYTDIGICRGIGDYFKCLCQKNIAGQHSGRLVKSFMAGRSATAQIIIIHAG